VARPRKVNTDEMLKIVNDCYEKHGNAACLKCSFLADYAASNGMEVRAYDLRRNPVVRARIDELKNLMPFSSDSGQMAYKNLDVNAFLKRTHNKESLKSALIELDDSWRKIYERACTLLKEKESLARSLKQSNTEHERLQHDYDSLFTQMQEIKVANKKYYNKKSLSGKCG
jgi:arsenate reductase-like glutaredoxin family protein